MIQRVTESESVSDENIIKERRLQKNIFKEIEHVIDVFKISKLKVDWKTKGRKREFRKKKALTYIVTFSNFTCKMKRPRCQYGTVLNS